MNSRIRERGLTSKEMAYNRDQVSNELKPSDDETLTKQQTEKREARHPKELRKNDVKYEIGDNVFLKSDKSKLRGRENYKVVRLFKKNEEEWAVIQKCESKFMSKEYEVKLSEIFPLPKATIDIDTDPDDNDENDLEIPTDIEKPDETESLNASSTDNSGKPNPKTTEKDVQKTNDPIKAELVNNEVNQKPSSARPPRRLAALRSRAKLQDIISCLHTKQASGLDLEMKPPTHGWNYDDWIRDIDDEPYYEEAEGLEESAIDTTNNLVNEESTETENYELPSPLTEPFQRLLDSLAPSSVCLPAGHARAQLSMGLLQVFPPAEEDLEMVWDDTTTPPELVRITEDQIAEADRQIDDVLKPLKLFDTDDTEDLDDFTAENSINDVFEDDSILEASMDGVRKSRRNAVRTEDTDILDDLEDLTSEDSIDDVFEDTSILEVSIDGVRRFRRQNALRRKFPALPAAQATEPDDEDSTAEVEGQIDDSIDATPEIRPRRHMQPMDYALYNRTGKKKK